MSACVVVIVSGHVAEVIRGLRSEIGSAWGCELSHPTTDPHLTVVTVSVGQKLDLLRPGLAAIAASSQRFQVSGAGFGIFPAHGSESPVLHLALTRTPQLSAFHQEVVRVIDSTGVAVDGQTMPRYWRPHVTLADTGLTPSTVGEITRWLVSSGPRHWTIAVDNISVVTPDGSIRYRLPFGDVRT